MTIRMSQYGKFLITRQDANQILDSVSLKEPPTLDFADVSVANHPFVDALAKGIASQLSVAGLHSVRVENANGYVKNCVEAGFATAEKAA